MCVPVDLESEIRIRKEIQANNGSHSAARTLNLDFVAVCVARVLLFDHDHLIFSTA